MHGVCLAASLAFTHHIPVTPLTPRGDKSKTSLGIVTCSQEGGRGRQDCPRSTSTGGCERNSATRSKYHHVLGILKTSVILTATLQLMIISFVLQVRNQRPRG